MQKKNANSLAQQLGDNYNMLRIQDNFASTYESHPFGWNFSEKFLDIIMPSGRTSMFDFSERSTFSFATDIIYKYIQLIQKEIKYTDGDIYNGTLKHEGTLNLIR